MDVIKKHWVGTREVKMGLRFSSEAIKENRLVIKNCSFLSASFGGKEKMPLDAGSKTRRRFLR